MSERRKRLEYKKLFDEIGKYSQVWGRADPAKFEDPIEHVNEYLLWLADQFEKMAMDLRKTAEDKRITRKQSGLVYVMQLFSVEKVKTLWCLKRLSAYIENIIENRIK